MLDKSKINYLNLKEIEIEQKVVECIPAKFASYYKIMPFENKNGMISFATTKPDDIQFCDEIGSVVDAQLNPVLASEKDILEAIRKYYGVGAETIEQMMGSKEIDIVIDQSSDNLGAVESQASISKFLNQILIEAYRDRATDVHIEPFEDELQIRYRVDGILYDAKVPLNIKHFKDSINSRIKILSNLNIAEKRMPQDGRFKLSSGKIKLDLRVSFLPTQYGESVVLRILNATSLYDFKEIGMTYDEITKIKHLIKKSHGIIFLTGPTGSGKTTTLYSCLSKINTEEKKIITIEDPIEYQLKGITQIQINPMLGLTFSRGLRSMLRHDPDIMMVGEVRDIETAEIAVQVALTGHLIFSTLHTNDAASGIARLLDMGVDPYLITSTVQCFIAQRLVRKLCPKCKQKTTLDEETFDDLEIDVKNKKNVEIYESNGCESCRFTGYSGRQGIYEFMILNDSIRDLVTNRASASTIKEKAIECGMKTLNISGWEKIKEGITSPQEVLRVTQQQE